MSEVNDNQQTGDERPVALHPAGSPLVVPWVSADVETVDAVFQCLEFDLADGRSLCVGVSKTGNRDRIIKICSPTKDGKTSELKFGLKGDSADALLHLLTLVWNEENAALTNTPLPDHES
jgi:hypothetical protein